MSLILHQLWWDGLETDSLHAVAILAALWLLVRPTSVGRFALMLAAEVVAVGHDLPYVGDHTLVVFVTGVAVLALLGWTLARNRRLPAPGELFDTIAPFLRVQLIIVYAAAALSKLNTDFLDPQTSCAGPMSQKIIWFDPTLLSGTWRITPSIWATVAVEIALPILLAVPRTRVIGLALGCAFHVVLALAGNVPFSAVALALYVAFLPTHTVSRLHTVLLRHRRLRSVTRTVTTPTASVLLFAVGVGLWFGAARVLGRDPWSWSDGLGGVARLAIVVMVGLAGVAFVLGRRRGGTPEYARPRSGRRLGHPILIVAVAMLLANAACPYLGLRSESTFTMFSNLRTEQGAWNHLFIPESVRIFGFQDRLVTVVATDDPALAARTSSGTELTRFELDRYLRAHPRAKVTWSEAGPDGAITRSRGPVAAAPGETFAEKLFHFKDVRPREDGDCG
ncbi:HTTM domain-containing protein [Williamsia maris]|uniref:Vitamin K-dependent gamma-carboxylase n=1 Tax=Williamsia maris TaxID=72806 RepID=A0ABT1HD22_9NOCA|nr:HTTM domain-containing protein [Williamsia maris]MCP2176064.1 Vitamin K-dependent gamma-carboxylase [Williamsia maris]